MPQSEPNNQPVVPVGAEATLAAAWAAGSRIRQVIDTVEPSTLARVFSMRPERAVAWFESLGIRVTWDWRADWRRAEGHAFTVAKVAETEVLAAIKEEIAGAIRDGTTQVEWRRRLKGRLRALGWLGGKTVVDPQGRAHHVDISTPWRQQTIFRTNTQSAYNAGRQSQQQDLIEAAPFWQYVAVMDARTRPEHAAMHGRIYRADDPIWRTIYPPNGYNCRCRVRMLTQAMVERRGLQVLSSVETPAEQGFPDEGFGQAPLDGAKREQAMQLAAVKARQRGDAAAGRARTA